MKDIEGYEGFYSVSRDGRVWTHRRGKYLNPGSSSQGKYLSVCLTRDGKVKCFSIHRLVASAFIENPDNKPQVNHIDGNKRNNNAYNLEWVTGSENMKHAHSTGLIDSLNGVSSRFIKGFDPRRRAPRLLTESQVVMIRNRHADGETFRSISESYSLDESSIRRCCRRQSYKDIM
jgi:hypothetical protein